jgi:hypothetical protein
MCAEAGAREAIPRAFYRFSREILRAKALSAGD